MSEARAFINPKMQNYHTLKAGLTLSGHAASKFDVLNSHIYNTVVKSGELVIVGDWSTPTCTSHEAFLMSKAHVTHIGLARSGQGADEFFLENFELLKGLLTHAATGAGVASDGWSRHLKSIQQTLQEIEKLHKEYLGSGTLKAREIFYAKRSALFARLEEQLAKLSSFGSGLRNKGPIKKVLGLSTKSFLHTGEIAGYADKVSGVAKAASLIKKGSYVGIALGVGATELAIHKACTEGREDECSKAKIVERTSLIGGVAGGAAGGYAGTLIGPYVCAAFGISTGGSGAIVCAVVGGAIGGKVVGDYSAKKGKEVDEFLYRERSK